MKFRIIRSNKLDSRGIVNITYGVQQRKHFWSKWEWVYNNASSLNEITKLYDALVTRKAVTLTSVVKLSRIEK